MFTKLIIGGIIFSVGMATAGSLSFPELLVHWIFPASSYMVAAIGVGFMINGLVDGGMA